MAPIGPLGDGVLAEEAEIVREKVIETGTWHGREDAAVVGAAVAAVAAAVGCTRRTTAFAAAPMVKVAAVRSFRSTPAAVDAAVAVVVAARCCRNMPAAVAATVAVVAAAHSCSTPTAFEIATVLAAVPDMTRSRSLRSRRCRVVSVGYIALPTEPRSHVTA